MPNIERLRTLLEYAEKLTVEQIDMSRFKSESGTPGCLAGHAALSVFKDEYKGEYILPWTMTFFELTGSEWDELFSGYILDWDAVPNLRQKIEEWEDAEH